MAVAIARRRNNDDDGERLQLRRAIEHAQNTKVRLAKLREAIERATEHRESAAAKLRDMTAAAAKAKADFAILTAAAIGKGESPPVATTLQDARAAETEAADQASASHAALAQLEQQLTDLEIECAKADNRVVTAANGLLVEPMRELFAQARKAQAELLACRSALQAIYSDANAPRFTDEIRAFKAREERNAPLAALKADQGMKDFVHVGGFIDHAADAKAAEAGQLWARMKAALLVDADTDLPSVERVR